MKHIKNAVKTFVVNFIVISTLGAISPAFLGLQATATTKAILRTASRMAAMTGLTALVGGLLSKNMGAVGDNFGSKIAGRDAQAPRQLIYGRCRVGGTVTHLETAGTDNHKLRMIIVIAGHEIESLESIQINDETITSVAGSGANSGFRVVTNSKYTNTDNENDFGSGRLMRFVFKDGSQTTADSTITSNSSLGANDKFIDCAYLFVEMVFDSEAFGGGIPPFSFIVKGKKVFDPRDSNQTFGNPATHTFSTNPALHVLDYLKDTTYGLKATESELNLTGSTGNEFLGSFRQAANTCDTLNAVTTAVNDGAVNNSTTVNLTNQTSNLRIQVGHKVTGTGISGTVKVVSKLLTGSGGSTHQIVLDTAITINNTTTLSFGESSYTSNGFSNFSADGSALLEGILSSMAGKITYVNGKFCIFAGASGTADMTITDDNLLEPIQVITKPNTGECYNTVKAIFPDANADFVATDTPVLTATNPSTSATYLSEDTPSGESQANYRKELELQLPFTETSTMAQRIARTQLLHSRQDTTISMLCNINFLQLQPFDYVKVTNERLGFTNKNFEVISMALEIVETEGVPIAATRLDLKEIDNAVWTFAQSDYISPSPDVDLSSVSSGSFSVPAPTSPAVTLDKVNTGYDLKVTWSSAVDDNVQGTEILYGTSSGTYDSSILAGKGSNKEIINNVKPDTTYFICLRHFSSNNVFSDKTSEISIATGGADTPATISDLSRVQDKPFHIGLSWTNPNASDLREIRIHRATSSFTTAQATNSNLVRTIGAAPNVVQQASFGVEDGLTAGTTYYFRVVPVSYFNKVGTASNEVNGSFAKVAGTDIQTDTRIVAGTHPNVGVLDGSHNSLRIYAGNLNTPTSAPFQVTQTGLLTAENATISGTIKSGQEIQVGSGARTVNISGVTQSATILTAGSDDLSNAPFRVLADGTVELTKVNIFTTDGGQVFDKTSGFTGLGITSIAQELGASTSDYTKFMLSTDTVKITLSNSDTSTSQDHTLTFKSRFSGILRGRTSSGNINTAIQKIPNKIKMRLMQNTSASTSGGTEVSGSALGGAFSTGASRVTSITNASEQFLITTFTESDNFFTTNEANSVIGQGLINSDGFFETSTNLTLTVPSGQSSKEFFFYIEIAVEVDNSDATATAVGTRGRTLNITGDSFFVDETTGAGSDSSVGDITAVVAGTNLNGGGTSGSVTLNLDSTITGNHTFSNNLIVGGDLTVQGTTTTIDTTNLDVKDKNITLNFSTGDSSANANGAGITIQDAVDASTDATILWNATTDKFEISHSLDFPDNAFARFGNGADLRISHNGAASLIQDVGTGDLLIRGENLKLQNASGENYLVATNNDATRLYFDNAEKLATTSTGIDVTGIITTDGLTTSADINFGDDDKAVFGAGNDLQIDHDSANTVSRIIDNSGTLNIQQSGDDGVIRFQSDDGSGGVTTYYQIQGASELNQFFKNIKLGDNLEANFGTSNDLRIYHDGNDSRIQEVGTGNLLIDGQNRVSIRRTDNGNAMGVFIAGGAVELYHNAGLRFSTLAHGNRLDSGGGNFNTTASSTVGISAQIKNSSASNNNGDYKGAIGFTTGTTNNVRSAIAAKQTHTSANRQGIAFLVHPDTTVGTLSEALVLNHDSTATFGAGVTVTGTVTADTHFTSSDSNATLSTSGTGGTVRLRPNGSGSTSGQLTVQSTGNVGIGNDSPSVALDVAGNVRIIADDTSNHSFEVKRASDGSQALRIDDSGEVVVSNNYLYASGSGTSFYSQGDAVFRATIRNDQSGMPVKVSDDFNVTGAYQSNGTTIVDASRNLTNINNITSTSNSGSASIYINSTRPTLGFTDTNSFSDANDIYLIRGTSGNKLQFQFFDHSASSTTETFNIDNSGNATFAGTINSGVITSTGASSGRYTGLEVVNSTNAGGTETAIGLGVVSASNTACDVKLVANRVGANSGSDFYIEQTDSSGSQQETFRITESGNVLIGTNVSPFPNGTGLGVASSSSIARLILQNSTTGTGTSNGFRLGVIGNNVEFENVENGNQSFFNNGAERFKIASDGKTTFNSVITIPATVPSSKGGKALRFPVDADTSGTTELEFYTPLSSPASTLTVNNTLTAGAIDIPSSGTSDTRIEIGTSPLANHFAYIDLVGDTTYNDYGLRLLRSNGGANTNSQLVHRGTGGLFIEAQDAGSVILKTNGSDGLTIDSSQTATFSGIQKFSKSVYGDFSTENFYRIKFQDQGGITNDVGIGQFQSGALGFNVTQGQEFRFNEGTDGVVGVIGPNGVDARQGGFRIGTTTVIDSSRNLTNIGTISSGAITSSGQFLLNVAGAGTTVMDVQGNYSANGDVKLAQFKRSGGAVAAAIEYNDATTDMEFGTVTSHAFSLKTADTRRLTIDSSGNLLVNTTNTAPYATSSVGGMVFRADFNLLGLSRNNNYALSVNRYGTDGDIVNLRKNGTAVGSIGVLNSNNLTITCNTADHGGLQFGTHEITPMEAGSDANGTINLGSANARFQDLHLSGTINSGDITVGVQDTTNGTITIHGGASGNSEGGEIRLQTSADHDGTYDFYRVDVNQDDFRIGRAGTTDFYIFQDGLVKAENNFQAGGTGSFGNLVNALAYQVSGQEVISNARKLDNISGFSGASSVDLGYDFNCTDSTANATFTGMMLDHNASGSDTLDADRTHRALYIDQDSSASGGDTSNEHRLYGLHLTQDASGDSDLVYGANILSIGKHTSGQISALRGINSTARANTSANLSLAIGVAGSGQVQGAGTVTAIYGGFFKGHVLSTNTANRSNAYGVLAEVEHDSDTTLTNAYAIRSIIDRDNGTITNGYLLHGSYEGTRPTNAYGLYISSDVKNYFAGTVTIGNNTPDQNGLNVHMADAEVVINDTNNTPVLRLRESGTTKSVITTSSGALTLSSGGTTTALTLDTSQNATFAEAVLIGVGKRLRFGGGNHTYISEDINDRLRFFTGGAEFMRFTEDTTNQLDIFQPLVSSQSIRGASYKVGTTQIIDSSRNLTNIASIDMTGALTDSAVNRGIKFDSASMKPSNGSGGDADNHIDLGTSSARFKNLHLSGTISSGAITSSGLTVQPAIGAGDALVTVAQTNVNAYVHAGIKINAGNTNPFYIYQSGSSNTLRFNYNSLSDAGGQMVLTDAGRVGIGTASPSHPLHILGTSNDTIDETKGNLKVQGGGGNGLIFGTIASSPYTSYIQSAYVVDTSLAQYNIALNPIGGNVGIGLTNPAKPLHIYAASNQLRIEDSTNGKKYDLNVDSSNFMVDDMSAGVNRFTIANGGNTGVGTSSPSYKFDVYGEDDVTMRIHRPNSGLASTDSCGIGFSQRGDGNTSTTDTRAGIFSNYNGDLFLAVEAAGNLNSNPIDHSALFIEGANARVGIGTTSPSSKLHIEDASSPVVLVRDTTNNCTLQMYAQNSNVHIGTSSNHSLFFDTNNTQRVELTTAGVLNCGNDVAAFGTLSDITLKENIKVIENPLDKVKQIRGVNFSYKKDGRKSTGLIAQELEKVLPNAIFTTNEINDDKEIKAIRYGNVVGLLVEAIKEQQEQIEELKAKLEEVA